MLKYLARRAIQMIPTFLGITLVTFLIIHLAPGDPITLMAGGATLKQGAITKAAIEHFRHTMGLDKPLWLQYLLWLKRIVTFHFGISYSYPGQTVMGMIAQALPITLLLSSISIALSYLIAVPIGIHSAVKQDSLSDRITTVVVFVLYSMPSFWVAIMLILFFATGLHFNWFPIQNFHSLTGFSRLSAWGKVRDVAWHITLPVICLTYGSLASLSRYMRTGMLEVIRQDYIRTARAKGLAEWKVVGKHALRNSLIPIVTLLGLYVPALIGGSVIVEEIFGVPGMGWLGFQAILTRDYNLIMAITVMTALLTMAGILLSDLLYAWVDPRIHFGEERR